MWSATNGSFGDDHTSPSSLVVRKAKYERNCVGRSLSSASRERVPVGLCRETYIMTWAERQGVRRKGDDTMRTKLVTLTVFGVACFGGLLVASPAAAQWTLFEETTITGTISGSIKKGHIFRTRSGHIYEVADYVYLYEYEYSPNVIVLADGGSYKLIIEGFDEPLLCKCLNCDGVIAPSLPDSSASAETTIKAAQVALTVLGFDAGTADGIIGAQTRSAVKRFRAEAGLAPTENLDATALRSLANALAKKYSDNTEAQSVAAYLMRASEDWPPRQPQQERSEPRAPTAQVVESFIVSDFDGLEYGNIYELGNGQIWEQTEAWIWMRIWVNPKVIIWNDGGVYRMKVEGIEHPVAVTRIK